MVINRNDLEYRYHEMLNSDERATIEPLAVLTGLEVSISAGSAKRMIESFESSGLSTHSGRCSTLWVIWTHCMMNHIPFEMKGQLGAGIYIKKSEIPL